MLEVTKCAPQHAIMNLGKAFKNFFRDPENFRFPQFKKKFHHDSFTISTTKSRSKVHAYASPIWGGCACAKPLR